MRSKNERWSSFDKLITDLGATALSYSEMDFVGDENHR